jgi:outer membrane protein OmpA-like peptidoglycan-associated protein
MDIGHGRLKILIEKKMLRNNKNFLLLPIFRVIFVINIFSYNTYSQSKEYINVLEIPNGGFILKAPISYQKAAPTSNFIVDWSKEALIDGTGEKGWSIRQGEKFPYEFIFELPLPASIDKFGFNTVCEEEFPGISAKDVSIFISTTSSTDGYIEAGHFTLLNNNPQQYFSIEKQTVRWIKLIIHSNHGYDGLTELMEFEAWGTLNPIIDKPVDLTGDWVSTWGTVSIRQIGASIHGCYQYRNGKIVNAGIDNHILTFDWKETGPNGLGKAILVLNEESKRLNGIWCFKNDFSKYGVWTFDKKSNSPSLCYKDSINPEEQKQLTEQFKQDLFEQGKIVMYGINFESNSATLKQESIESLNQILTLLNENKALKIRIEGHTDNTGSKENNKRLSAQRASSVKDYLVQKGIKQERLTMEGKGDSTPISTNETELGKATNRRVEFWLLK